MILPSAILGVLAAAAPAAEAASGAPGGSGGVGFWEGLVLGLIQGVTEFLPVSSSGHLAIGHWLFHETMSKEVRVAFDVTVHAATLLAMVVYFRQEIAALFTTRRVLILWILLGSVPAATVGLLFRDAFESLGGYPLLVAGAFVLNGIFLAASNYFGVETRRLRDMTAGDSLLVGLAQAVAITPGISRSGSTIAAGIVCGLQREEAFTFSFLLGMPAIAGATLLEGRQIEALALSGSWAGLVVGFLVAFVAGLASIWLLSKIVKRRNLLPFGLYTIALAFAILVVWIIKS
jgi:undecaprenyl-diphosphatase